MAEGDSTDYRLRKRFYDSLLTIYGRKPVLEALEDPAIPVFRLHLAESNRAGGIVADIEKAAKRRQVEVLHHSREALSRISRNRKQDQGVAADLQCPNYRHYQDLLDNPLPRRLRLIALDRITNPQNLGMVIRAVSASPVDGLLLPDRGSAPLSPLVIKASAGTLFHCPLLRCRELAPALADLAAAGADICTLSGSAADSLASHRPAGPCVYVLGNETEGVSKEVAGLASRQLRIPMRSGVESLNVAVAAGLVAFREVFAGP